MIKTKEQLSSWLEEYEAGAISMDGYEDCVIGFVGADDDSVTLVYALPKVIDKLMNAHGMSRDEAWEFHKYNQQDGGVLFMVPTPT